MDSFDARLAALRARGAALEATLGDEAEDARCVSAVRAAQRGAIALSGYAPLMSVCAELCFSSRVATPRLKEVAATLARLRRAGVVTAAVLGPDGAIAAIEGAAPLVDVSASCWRLIRRQVDLEDCSERAESASNAAVVASSALAAAVPFVHENYKTELCRHFSRNNVCRKGASCRFAHGDAELRTTTTCSSVPPRVHTNTKKQRKLAQRRLLAGTAQRNFEIEERRQESQLHVPVRLPPILDESTAIGAMLKEMRGSSTEGQALFDGARASFEMLYNYYRDQSASLEGGGGAAATSFTLPAEPLRSDKMCNCIVDAQNYGPSALRLQQLLLLLDGQRDQMRPLFVLPRLTKYTTVSWTPQVLSKIIWCPAEHDGDHDDLFVIEAALERDAILISNDQYRDCVQFLRSRQEVARAEKVRAFLLRNRRAWSVHAESGTVVLTPHFTVPASTPLSLADASDLPSLTDVAQFISAVGACVGEKPGTTMRLQQLFEELLKPAWLSSKAFQKSKYSNKQTTASLMRHPTFAAHWVITTVHPESFITLC